MGLACAGFCNYLEQVDADQAHLQKQILFKKVEPSGTKTLHISVSPVLRGPMNQKVSGLLGEIAVGTQSTNIVLCLPTVFQLLCLVHKV